MLYNVFYKLKIIWIKQRWKKINKANFTTISRIFPLDIVEVGTYTYGVLNVYSYGSKNEKLTIGNYVSIGPNVNFLLGGHHNLNTLSTYPFKVKINGEETEATSKGQISIGDDVWIGMNAVILSGVNIGRGAVIGAGSIVTKDIPAYAIVGGNPAKIIKYRFSEDIINEMLKLNFSYLTEDDIKNNIEELYGVVTKESLDTKFLKSLRKEY